KARGGKDQGLFEGGPGLRRDLEGRVELLGGVAPLHLIDDGIGGRGWHGVRRSGRETQNTYRDRFASNESSTPAQVPPLSALPRQSGRPGPEQSSMGRGASPSAFEGFSHASVAQQSPRHVRRRPRPFRHHRGRRPTRRKAGQANAASQV